LKSVEDLDVFKLSHEMTLAIYKMTKNFPDEERFGLISQMRKAAYSVPMNLACPVKYQVKGHVLHLCFIMTRDI